MKRLVSFTQLQVKVSALMWLVIICTACSTQAQTPQVSSGVTSPGGTPSLPTEESGDSGSGSMIDIATEVANRTPVPTSTPGRVERRIEQFVQDAGLEGSSFLGLTAEDWINLGISVLIILIGYWAGLWILSGILRWFVRRTNIDFDDSFVEHILPELKMLVMLFLTNFAVQRLDFISGDIRRFLEDFVFVLGLLIITVIAVRLINFGTRWYKTKLLSDEDRSRLRPVITAANRFGLFIVFVLATSIGMSHFGINIGALSITVIVVAVVISFGARNIIGDALSGFIILADQPFRVNDGVLIKEMDTWGDVLEIGTLTTRILTVDNREEIVPNAKIVASKVVNYTYPDPNYRMQVDIGIAFGSDLVLARQVITDALKKVDHIVPEKKTEVLFIGFGETNRQIRVRWWIDDYHQQWTVLDQACTAIESALAEANIEMPFDTYNLNVSMQPDRTAKDSPDDDQKVEDTPN